MNTPTKQLLNYAEEKNLKIWQIIFEDVENEALYAPAKNFTEAKEIAKTYIKQWNLETKINTINEYK